MTDGHCRQRGANGPSGDSRGEFHTRRPFTKCGRETARKVGYPALEGGGQDHWNPRMPVWVGHPTETLCRKMQSTPSDPPGRALESECPHPLLLPVSNPPVLPLAKSHGRPEAKGACYCLHRSQLPVADSRCEQVEGGLEEPMQSI